MERLNEVGTPGDLSRYRIERAKEDLHSAEILLQAEDYRGANNRAYYAIYHAITSINALDQVAYKRHKDTIGNFNKDYVKSGIFPREFGRRINEAFEIRHASDYDDFYIATKAEVIDQIETAKDVIKEIESYCCNRMSVLLAPGDINPAAEKNEK